VNKEVVKIETKKNKNSNHAGVQRNDLPGKFKVRGNKISIRYKGRDIATKCSNTLQGWKLANKFWEEKYEEIDAIISGEKDTPDTIKNIFEKFIAYKKQYNNISKNTAKLYDYRIKKIFGANLDDVFTEKLIKKSIEKFIKNTTLEKSTINNILVGNQIFFNWASEEENNFIPKKNYIKKYKQTASKSVKPPYTEDEYKMFVSHFEDTNNKEMSLFIQFLWNTGARVSEAISIKIDDIDFENNYILIPNKIFKSQQETLLLTGETKEIIQKIISLNKSKNGKLFSWKNSFGATTTLNIAEKKLNIKIKKRGFHGFRRGFADRLIRSGVKLQDTQKILRHRDITTTEKYYTNMYKEELIEEMNEKLK
jgi:integrase/recombinase XerD